MKITRQNYFGEYDQLSDKHKTENFKKTHTLLLDLFNKGKSWAGIDEKQVFVDMAEKQFKYLELLIAKHGSKKPSVPSTPKVKATSRKVKPQDKPKVVKQTYNANDAAKAIRKVAPRVNPGAPVETVDPHLIMLSRYLRMDGKTVPRERIIGLARTLVKQIEARILRKASKHSGLIEKMREHLFELIDKSKGANIRVAIPEKTKKTIAEAGQGEHQMKSVQLLRRYAGMAGRITNIDKAKRLYNAMVVAIEKEQVPQDDRYFERVIEVSRLLKSYVERGNERKQLPLLPAELSGVLGCSCEDDDGELNGVPEEEDSYEQLDEAESRYEAEHDAPQSKSEIPICSTDFMHKKFARYPIQEPWVKIFGEVEPGKHTIIYAKEKLGKTTAMVDFAGYLSRHHGPVLFVQKEEELSGTFQDKLEQTRAANPNLFLAEDLPSEEELRQYKFVILDSVTRLNLSPAQLRLLQHRLGRDTTIFAITHATKDGKHRGGNDYVHDAAQIVTFPEFGAAYGRGRFKGATGELIRFTDPRE